MPLNKTPAPSIRTNVLVILLTIVGTAMVLALYGRNWWCADGDWLPWSFDAWSMHNSQHLLDWYTPSHISHGLIFYWLLSAITPVVVRPYRISIAALLEASWELLENSDFIINRYREATMALDYFGDSISNSLADILWCLGGYLIASQLRTRYTLALFVAFEFFTLVAIRDNLTLNVLMLVCPVESIKSWQMEISPFSQ